MVRVRLKGRWASPYEAGQIVKVPRGKAAEMVVRGWAEYVRK